MLRLLQDWTITSVPNSVNDMACCVISFTALTDLISWYRTIDSLYSNGFVVDPAGPGLATSARKLPPWQSPSPTCSRQAHHGKCHDNVHSEVLRVARHTVGSLFLHCRWITEQPTHLTIWLIRRWREAEPLPFCFHCPRMCMVVFFFRENAYVAILGADSKRSFRAAWNVMNNCRSQFGWQCAQLKESAIRLVVERQV